MYHSKFSMQLNKGTKKMLPQDSYGIPIWSKSKYNFNLDIVATRSVLKNCSSNVSYWVSPMGWP